MVGDSHSTQLQGPIGLFHGEFSILKICFQSGVLREAQTSTESLEEVKEVFTKAEWWRKLIDD